MKKKLTKFAAFVLATAVAVTASGVPVAAGGGAAVEPEIMFYRDFEDYNGGDPYNATGDARDYGTWGIYGDGTYDDAIMVEGADGRSAKLHTISNNNNTNRNDGTTAFNPKTEGKLYFAFDLDTSANVNAASGVYTQIVFRESGATEGTYGSDLYAFVYEAKNKKYVGGDIQYSGNASWQVNTTTGVSADSKNRIELVADIDNGKIYKYINGVLGATYDDTGYDKMDDIAWITFNPKGGNVIDNLTVVHYPSDASQQTFKVESAGVNADNTFSVYLKGSVTDSDAKGTDVKTAITAYYPVTLADGELTADAFSIDGLTVTSVTRGARAGEYKIAVSEGITPGVNYTITATTGLEDITGAIVSDVANTATAMKVPQPEVMFYRDFEDYTGGNNMTNPENAYGTFMFTFDNDFGWGAATAENGSTGIGFRANQSNVDQGSIYNKRFPESVLSATDGKIYITMTSEKIPGIARTGRTAFGMGNSGYRLFGFQHGNQYSTTQWMTSGMSNDLPEKDMDNYLIGIVLDMETGIQDVYVNNVLISSAAWNANITIENSNSCYTGFYFENGVIIDNFAMVYYPENLQQTFSISAVEADEKADVFRVFLNSDTVDPDGKGASVKSAIAAPYGISLPTDASVCYALNNDTFTVDGMEVTSVTRGTRPGEYIVEVSGDIVAEESYTVSAKAGLVDILGAVLNSDADSKTVTVAPKLSAEVTVSGDTATVVFNDDISNPMEYAKGATVRNVYTGETGTATLAKVGSNKATIGGYSFAAGDEYEVTLPDTLRGKKGNSLSDNTVLFNLATTNSLKKLSLVDIQGNKLDLAQINPVGLESIDLEFTADVTASAKTIEITDEGGAQFTDYTAAPSGNKTSLKLNKILAPGKTYTISVSGLAKAYAITLKTEDAKLDRLPVMFLDASGNSLESISVGDTVKVKMSFVNSTNDEKTFLASASMFAGLEMTGFAHKEITMKPVLNGGTGTHTETFTFTVSKTTGGVKLNGYMWSINEGAFAAIESFESFE